MLDGQLLNSSFVFFKQKTAYEMRISDWSSDVCSSDLYCIVHAAAAIKHFDAGAALYLAHVQCYVLRVGTRLVGVLDQIQQCLLQLRGIGAQRCERQLDRKSVVWGRSVSVRVGIGGRSIIKIQTHYVNTLSLTVVNLHHMTKHPHK